MRQILLGVLAVAVARVALVYLPHPLKAEMAVQDFAQPLLGKEFFTAAVAAVG
jgi:hypothetical protein